MTENKLKTETFLDGRVTQICGDVRQALASLPDNHFDCVVTSPPYWGLRDYGTAKWVGGRDDCKHEGSDRYYTEKSAASGGSGEAFSKAGPSNAERLKKARWRERGQCIHCGATHVDDQIGLERSLGDHLGVMVEVFREVRRVLKPTGTLWLNYGDCYATAPNGRSAADTKAAGGDDRTFRDKPFSTVGAIYDPNWRPASTMAKRSGRKPGREVDKKGEGGSKGRVVAGGYLKAKDLCMIPNRLAIALQDDGWWVRSEIIWHKPNPMPESTRDRPTSAHEKIWLMTKRERYFYDAAAIAEPVEPDQAAHNLKYAKNYDNPDRINGGQPGNVNSAGVHTRPGMKVNENGEFTRNARNVWRIGTSPFPEAHFATFPTELAERCIKAGCPAGGEVLDIFGGSGTTAMVAVAVGRRPTLIELNPEYCTLARARIEAAFMGQDEGRRHMHSMLGRVEAASALPLFGGLE